jgi:hypothetical protein
MCVHIKLSGIYLKCFSSLISRCESYYVRLVRLLNLEGIRPPSDIIKPFIVLHLVLKESLCLTFPNLRSRSLGFTLLQVSLVLNYWELVGKCGRLLSVSVCGASLFGTPSSHRGKAPTPKLMLHLLRLISQIRLQEVTVIIGFLNYSLAFLLIIHHLSDNLGGNSSFSLFELGFCLSLFVTRRYFFLCHSRWIVISMPTVKWNRW